MIIEKARPQTVVPMFSYILKITATLARAVIFLWKLLKVREQS